MLPNMYPCNVASTVILFKLLQKCSNITSNDGLVRQFKVLLGRKKLICGLISSVENGR